MRYTTYEICSAKGCNELVEVKKFTDTKVYCPKCEKKELKKESLKKVAR